MDELEVRMREVLVALSLLSNGRTSTFEAGGGSERDYTPTLSPGDAPQLYFARRWDQAQDDVERQAVLEAARQRLREEQGAGGRAPVRAESKAERDARIVAVGEGWEARDVAIHFRCGVEDVRKARRAAERDTEYGRRPQGLGDADRQAEVQRMASAGMNGRQIAFSLGVAYNTVRRDLGRNA